MKKEEGGGSLEQGHSELWIKDFVNLCYKKKGSLPMPSKHALSEPEVAVFWKGLGENSQRKSANGLLNVYLTGDFISSRQQHSQEYF